MIDESAIRLRFAALAPVLDERGRRRFAAAEAMAAGYGGVSAVERATGLARHTIGRGFSDLRSEEPGPTQGGPRRGAGRKPLSATDGGGSNGTRLRLWKVELQKLA